MQMWASSRVVVVLPLVPVTDATGMRGVTSRGPSPSGAAAATPAAAVAPRHPRRGGRRAGRRAPARSPRPAPRRGRGAARRRRTRRRRSRSRPGCARRAGGCPTSAARARATRSTSRSSTCWRCSDPGHRAGRGAGPASPTRAQRLVRSVEVAGQRQGHLDGRAREVQVRALEDAHLAGGDAGSGLRRGGVRGLAAHPGSLVGGGGDARAQTPIAWKPPSTCTISPVVAGNQSESRATQAFAAGSASLTSQPSGDRLPHSSSKRSKPGIDFAAVVRIGPAATMLQRMPLRPEVAGEVAVGRLERGLRHAHPVVDRPREPGVEGQARRRCRPGPSAAGRPWSARPASTPRRARRSRRRPSRPP